MRSRSFIIEILLMLILMMLMMMILMMVLMMIMMRKSYDYADDTDGADHTANEV